MTAISRLRANAEWNGCSPRSDEKQAIYNPPPGWAVVEYNTTVHSNSNGSSSVSIIAGDLNFVLVEEWKKSFDDLLELAAKYDTNDNKARIEQKQAEFSKFYSAIQSNKNTIRAHVSARAHGSCFDRKRGWIEISVTAELIYLGTKSDLEDTYKTFKNQLSLRDAEK